MALPGDQLVILIFAFVALSVFLGVADSYSGNLAVWAPALFLTIPLQICNAIASVAWFLAPFLVLAFFAYFAFLRGLGGGIGEVVLYLAVFSAVIMMIGA